MDHDADNHHQLVRLIASGKQAGTTPREVHTLARNRSSQLTQPPLHLVPLPLCRYASNTGLLILNKWLLSTYGFRKPVFLTLCHMLACSAMGAGASAARIVPPQPIKSPEQFRKIAGLAVVFCLSVVLGNVALRFIPVSFSQVRPVLMCADAQRQLHICAARRVWASQCRLSAAASPCCS
jgi:Triose-phosphate Transporter family